MPTPTPIALADLTTSLVDGEGVFDVLMRANKAHLEQEFSKNRIKGPEYAQVYLGSLQTVLAIALKFVMEKNSANQDAELKAKQIELVTAQIAQAEAQTLQVEAQTLLITQQRSNLVAEALNIPKQGALLDAQIAKVTKDGELTDQQVLNLVAEKLLTDAKVTQTAQQTTNLAAEALNIPKQGLLIDANKEHVDQQTLHSAQQTLLVTQQTSNAVLEGTVLVAQECKLRAEYDVILLTKDKTIAETTLLGQKLATEKAQVLALGVDDNSLVGRQKALYLGQTNGFLRDAEQKAAKLLVDTWSVRRTTNDATVADATNKLSDVFIGQAVTQLLTGVGA